MRITITLLIIINAFWFNLHGQNNIDVNNFNELLTYVNDTTNFWNEIEHQVNFPKKCQEIYASEKIEITVIKRPNSKLKFQIDYQNPLFGLEVKKLEPIFKKYISKNCKSIDMKFYVHFDLEPWYYPNYNDKKTNGGHLYSHEVIVIKEYIKPFLMIGG